MQAVVAENELYRSCEILFGLELNVSREFLEYLQHSGVRTAYRQKARETHPDLAAGKSAYEQRRHAALFQNVQEAYENLKAYLDAREKGYILPCNGGNRRAAATAKQRRQAGHGRSRRSASDKNTSQNWSSQSNTYRSSQDRRQGNGSSSHSSNYTKWFDNPENLYKGPIPERKLLFGHFLYYSGVINWRTIIQALVWQRMQRPRLGEIAKKYGWLDEKEIRKVLEYRTTYQPFGKSAVKLGVLSNQQLKTLVIHQKRLQKKIGHYFLETKIMSPYKLNSYLQNYHAHNARMKRNRSSAFNC